MSSSTKSPSLLYHTAEEQSLVEKLKEDNRAGDVWLGGTDLVVEGRWYWASSGLEMLDYKNFERGEPNDNGGENCLEVVKSKQWNDGDCESHNKFICQFHRPHATTQYTFTWDFTSTSPAVVG